MRLRLLSLLFASSVGLLAAAPSIERVWPEFRPAESFDRIAEYFGKPERHSGRLVLRSHPEDRAGFYFLVRVANAKDIPARSRWIVSVIVPGAKETRSYTFELPDGQTEPVALLGLTGTDWPDPKAHPLAWRVRLLGPDDKELAVRESFLWE